MRDIDIAEVARQLDALPDIYAPYMDRNDAIGVQARVAKKISRELTLALAREVERGTSLNDIVLGTAAVAAVVCRSALHNVVDEQRAHARREMILQIVTALSSSPDDVISVQSSVPIGEAGTA